jgi:pimeloyl-ACP methyl ester carboxylesterase
MPVVKVNNININYSLIGKGEPLVMIMGLNAPQSGWNDQISFFKKHYQLITFDNRGSGKSDKPKGPYSIRTMADDTVELMKSLGIDRANFMGTSMGGMIAQEIAINYPERVIKLVLASTYACQDHKSNGSTSEMDRAVQSSAKLGLALVNLAFNKPLSRFWIVLMVKIQSGFTTASEKASNKTGFEAQFVACSKHDALERLPLLKAPTLVITGTADRVVRPSSSEVIAGKVPNSRLVKIENGSHAVNMEMKNIFNQQVLSFLTDSRTNPDRIN